MSVPNEPASKTHQLDIVEDSGLGHRLGKKSTENNDGRKWIGVRFECCGVYTRVYRHETADRYEGRCPDCGAAISIRVGAEGLNTRFLVARPI